MVYVSYKIAEKTIFILRYLNTLYLSNQSGRQGLKGLKTHNAISWRGAWSEEAHAVMIQSKPTYRQPIREATVSTTPGISYTSRGLGAGLAPAAAAARRLARTAARRLARTATRRLA